VTVRVEVRVVGKVHTPGRQMVADFRSTARQRGLRRGASGTGSKPPGLNG